MKTEIYAELKGEGRQQPVFEGLQVQAELRETLAITTVTQSYRNAGSKNIEAVYTFPLPLDAVLLEMIVTLGDKTLKGTVLPKQEAEAKYEDAITDGNAPVMLQNPQPGVYTMNVGNLLPGDKARITIRYGMFTRWQRDSLRYHLPTTIAPRYGSAERAGFEPQQEPETSLMADNLFEFRMKVSGTMASMAIESPSHEIVVERDANGGESTIRLVRSSAFMDRDLIITVRNDERLAATALLERDNDEFLLWGSFQPQFNLTEDPAARSVKIVVDCSGSMGGDSISQAREALLRVLDELRPQDWFNIVAFGDRAIPLFNAQVKADRESLSYARGFLNKLDADMGGTEIDKALSMAVKLRCREMIQQDVLLITDGEIWEWESVVAKAVKSNHRFFTVGVGSSVSEAFVRLLAEQSGGACELVSPNENMAERIHRHFKRIGTPRSKSCEIIWPLKPLRVFPERLASIYDGDTCNLFAWFAEPPEGEVELKLSLPDGSTGLFSAAIGQVTQDSDKEAVISRMAAALKLREISDEEAGQELAVKYQLLSRWTNYLAVLVRDEEDKAHTLPALHRVKQMLAAGWGGTGTVLYSVAAPAESYDMPTFLRRSGSAAAAPAPSADAVRRFSRVNFSVSDSRIDYSIPAEPREIEDRWMWEIGYKNSLKRFIDIIDLTLSEGIMPTTIRLPLLPAGIEEILSALIVEDNMNEQTVVTIFLHFLADSDVGELLSRQAKRVIQKAYKELQSDAIIEDLVRTRLTRKGAIKKDGIVKSLSKRIFRERRDAQTV